MRESYSFKVEGLEILWPNITLENHGDTHVFIEHICCLLRVVKTVKITIFLKTLAVINATSSDSLGSYLLSNTLCP